MASTAALTFSYIFQWLVQDLTNPLAPRIVSESYPVAGTGKIAFPSGATTMTIDQLFTAQVSVPATGTATLDLTSGLTDPTGDAIDFARVVGFMFFNNDPTSKITMGGGTNPLGALVGTSSDTIDLNPQFPVIFGKNDATGYATSGSANTLTFTNGAGNPIIVDVLLFGRKE